MDPPPQVMMTRHNDPLLVRAAGGLETITRQARRRERARRTWLSLTLVTLNRPQ